MITSRAFLLFCVLGLQCLCLGNIKPLQKETNTIPTFLKGHFIDDYGISYNINDTVWLQLPNSKYHIISCDTIAQYLLVQNDEGNSTEAGLYTRIDYMRFSNMMPFNWGFCLTVYDAKSAEEAQMKSNADRKDPKKGCNGYPFSRMKIQH